MPTISRRAGVLAGAVLATATIGAGAAVAVTGHHPATPAQSTSRASNDAAVASVDTDEVQQGDQTSLDTKDAQNGDRPGSDTENGQRGDLAGADTDNVQQGDQTGPDRGQSDSHAGEHADERNQSESDASDGPSGHADPPGNVQHDYTGVE